MIYFARRADTGAVKIGWTTRDPKARIIELGWYGGRPLSLAAVFPGDRQIERGFHGMFAHLSLGFEWFSASKLLNDLIDCLGFRFIGEETPYLMVASMKQKQITIHLPIHLLERVNAESRAEEAATNLLTSSKGAHVPRNRTIIMLIERGLAAEPKAPELRADVGDIVP